MLLLQWKLVDGMEKKNETNNNDGLLMDVYSGVCAGDPFLEAW
jgi:hypothetical protein